MEHTTDAARLAYNAYLREWRHAHPDRVREHNRRYWERKAEKMQEEQQTNQTTGTEPENRSK